MDIIFHGSIVIAEHRIDHPVYFEELFDCIQVLCLLFPGRISCDYLIHQHDIPDKVFFIGKILDTGFSLRWTGALPRHPWSHF